MKKNIQLYKNGHPMNTGAVVDLPKYVLETTQGLENITFFKQEMSEATITLSYNFEASDMVVGFGETVKGLNKRGTELVSFCADEPEHLPNKKSLYGAHNFFVVLGQEVNGFFIDFPGTIHYDIGFVQKDIFNIKIEGQDVAIYQFKGETLKEVVQQFLSVIGQSYVPPKWGFGYQQCRWSYETADDIRRIAKEMRAAQIPCDTIYLDIDYMERFKDFSICHEKFPAFESFVTEMRQQGFRLIPIIDAGVKIEEGYDVYEEGIAGDHFCLDENGDPFVAAVWPGLVHFPDFFKEETRRWFGHKYKVLTDYGIDGFWNDMNEPAIFYTPKRLNAFYEHVEESKEKPLDIYSFFELKEQALGLSSSPEDYQSFYHRVDNQLMRHDKVHNLYGYYMTQSAAVGLERIDPNKRFLLFSRASYVGMHRYGGIWMGDNASWWEHIELSMKLLPAINMCGFMYTGPDTGGFQSDASSELLTRWMQFSIFAPLLRNHAAMGSRAQEPFAFEASTTETLRDIINLRYALIPYLYSAYMKAVKTSSVYAANLIMDYDDLRVREIEDQLLIGDALMIAPIYKQNRSGRMVYLPESMLLWKASGTEPLNLQVMDKGDHFAPISLEEVPLFIRPDKGIILGEIAQRVEEIDRSRVTFLGYFEQEIKSDFYDDDGHTKAYQQNEFYNTKIRVVKTEKDLMASVAFDQKSELLEVRIIIVDSMGQRYEGLATKEKWSIRLEKVS
jgi:alpha-glucosidase